jgi:trans-aconitate methyltransferase
MQSPTVDWNPETLGRGADYTRFVLLAGLIREFQPEGSLLDIGCGVGQLRKLVPDHAYTGLDLSLGDITKARITHQLDTFVHHAAEDWNPMGSYDVVVFNESLYYLRSFWGALEKYRAAIRPGGLLAVSIFRKYGWNSPTKRAVKQTREFVAQYCEPLKDVAISDSNLTWDLVIGRHVQGM